jgi:hypothetical protein
MTPKEIVATYYDAWQNRHGDLSEVPLADDSSSADPWPARRGPGAIARPVVRSAQEMLGGRHGICLVYRGESGCWDPRRSGEQAAVPDPLRRYGAEFPGALRRVARLHCPRTAEMQD